MSRCGECRLGYNEKGAFFCEENLGYEECIDRLQDALFELCVDEQKGEWITKSIETYELPEGQIVVEYDASGVGLITRECMEMLVDAIKPNNCKYLTNPSGDVWECGCCLEIFCEHQIYDRNPDGTLNIVECGYEPKTEPQIIACPIQEEDADYARWLYGDEPLTDAEITELAKAIVHKMIDNGDIAEDTYPDLKQRMHEAVERLDEYYPSEDERSE